MASILNATTTSGLVTSADNSGSLQLQTNNGTTAVTIDTSQRVGVNTTSPVAPLDIQSDTGAAAINMRGRASGDISSVSFYNNANTTQQFYIQSRSTYSILNTTINGYMAFATNDTERMRITSGGNVLIGTTTESPGGRLTVITGSDEAVWTKITAGASAANMVSWNSADSGNNYFHGFAVNSTGDSIGSIDYNRGAGLLRYNTTSDATLKNIIGDSDGQKSVEILSTTRIREFAWKNDVEQKTQIGVIAQELYETYKGAVSVGGENDKGEYRPWGVDKTAFTFHLIAGWQAHEKLIQELKAELDTVKAELNTLKNPPVEGTK